MKRTRKLIVALVLVMSILMTLAVAVIPASAATNIPANTVLYMKPSNTWKTDGARFAAYFFGNGEAWVSMTDNDGDGIYECTSPNKSYTNVIFCRMNPGATANNWNNKWNQTGNLTFDGSKNYYEPTEGWWDTMGDDCWKKHQCFDGPAATCETDQTCPLCGNVQKAKLGHSYDDGVVTTKPTCTEKGVKTFTCSTCEGTKTEDVASLGHNFVDGVCNRDGCDAEDPDYCAHSNVTHYEAKDATCTENGNIEYWLCVDCGQAWLDEAQTLNTNVLAVVLPIIDHSYKAVVTEPTCIKAGYTTYTCTCGDTYTGNATSATGNHVYNELGKCTGDAECSYVITYFINANKWSAVSAHCWTDGGASTTWPGNAASKTGVQVNGFDVYSVGVDASKYNKIIFNNNNGDKQTMDLDLVVGQYYHGLIGTWFESTENIPVVSSTKVFLAGSFCDWKTDRCNFVSENGGTVYTLILILPANTPYEFKVVNNGSWLGHSGTFTNDVTNKTFSANTSANCKITTACAGEYVFKFDSSSKKLSVTYPHIGGEATCTAKAKCDACGKEYGSSLGHNMITDAAVAPDCLNTGLTEGAHCSRCDHKVAQTVVPALGHTIEDGACACGAELTLEEKLSGTGTVVLGDLDLGEGDLVITGDVTVVLNGTIKAAGVAIMSENVSFKGNGKLAVDKTRFTLVDESKNMPVWVGDGYVFNEVTNQSKAEVGEDDSFNVVFRPSFGSTTHNEAILGGNIDAGLTFELQIWNGETKLFAGTIKADLIKQAYANSGAISIRVKNAPVGTYTVKLVIKSSVGITFTETLQKVEIKAVQSNDPIETPDDEFPQ